MKAQKKSLLNERNVVIFLSESAGYANAKRLLLSCRLKTKFKALSSSQRALLKCRIMVVVEIMHSAGMLATRALAKYIEDILVLIRNTINNRYTIQYTVQDT